MATRSAARRRVFVKAEVVRKWPIDAEQKLAGTYCGDLIWEPRWFVETSRCSWVRPCGHIEVRHPACVKESKQVTRIY